MSTIAELESGLANAQAVVDQRDRMLKLQNNRDFRALIMDGFCKEECARFTAISTDPDLSPEARADALGSAQAAGYLRRWMAALVTMGNVAERDAKDHREALDEARAEEVQADPAVDETE
jgi:hypothetical protein